MEQVGYSLIDANETEIQAYGGETPGAQNGVPDVLVLPNGDQVHCPTVGSTYSEWKLVERWLTDTPPSQWHARVGWTVAFDGTKIVVTINYEATPSIVPQTINQRQARLALLRASLLDKVEAAVVAAGGETKIAWDYSPTINRTDPLIATLGATLGLTPSAIDDLFRTASTL